MKFLTTVKDGGAESTVWAHILFEIKSLASIMLLRFEDGSREAYHSHAFDSVSWVLRGRLVEFHHNGSIDIHTPGVLPIITRRSTFHMVRSTGRTWVLTFRGPWANTWQEIVAGRRITLTHGRKEVQK